MRLDGSIMDVIAGGQLPVAKVLWFSYFGFLLDGCFIMLNVAVNRLFVLVNFVKTSPG